MKRLYTGVAVRPAQWNKSHRRVSSRVPDHEQKNDLIRSHYVEALNHPENYLAPDNGAKCDFYDILRDRMNASTSLNTRRSYTQLLTILRDRYGDSLPANMITAEFADRFYAYLRQSKASAPAMLMKMQCIFRAVCRHGVATGRISFAPEAQKGKIYNRCNDRNMQPDRLNALLSLCRTQVAADPELKQRDTYALALFALCFAFQGLAPVDIAGLHVGDLTISGDAVEVSLCRRKTGRPVQILASAKHLQAILTPMMAGKGGTDYLIDCYSANENLTDSQRIWRLANYFHTLARHLPQVDGHNITYYYARHAYCNAMEEADVPHHIIRKLIGHSSGVLERSYLRPPSRAELLLLSQTLLAPLRPEH